MRDLRNDGGRKPIYKLTPRRVARQSDNLVTDATGRGNVNVSINHAEKVHNKCCPNDRKAIFPCNRLSIYLSVKNPTFDAAEHAVYWL